MAKMLYSIGFWVRETGQALDRLGCRLQGSHAFKEERKSATFPLQAFVTQECLGVLLSCLRVLMLFIIFECGSGVSLMTY
jgi:hypothetical protein